MDLLERIKQLEDEANAIEYKVNGGMSNSTKPEQTKVYKKTESFISDDPQTVIDMLSAYNLALGKANIGNSRLGSISAFYKDLIISFFRFKKDGLRLPRWSISKKHAQSGLFDILKSHGYIPDEISYEEFISSPSIRSEIHHKVERIFVRVANAIEEKPPQK